MLRWSIATVCMGGSLESKLAAAAKAGFRAVELFENDLTFFKGKPRDVRRMAADLGIEIVALQPLRNFEAMPDSIRHRNFERARRKMELMHELSVRLLCLCSNVLPEAIDDPARAANDLAELAEIARQQGMVIGYEALAWGRHVRDWTAAWDIVRDADCDNLGIVLDSFHICARDNPIVADRRASQREDNAGAGGGRSGSRDGSPVSKPALSLLPRPGRLSDRGLSRRDDARWLSRPAVASNLQRSVSRRFGRGDRGGRNPFATRGGRRAGSETRRPGRCAPRGLPPLPPAPEVQGIEFVEFAAPEADARKE